MLDIAFFLQDLLGPVTEGFDISFLDIVALFQLFDPLIKIVVGGSGSGSSLLRHF